MKRKITSILIASTLIFSVGCSSKEESEATIETNTTNIASKNNEKEVYEIHKEMFPKVKEVFKEYGLDAKEKQNIENKYYSGPQGMIYEIFDNITPGDIYYAKYGVGISNNEAVQVYADLFMEVDPEVIKSNGFKMEETFFATMDKVMVEQDIDYTEVNQEIVDAYNNGGFLDSTKEYGNVSCRVTADGSMLSYTISIHPEK